MPQNLFGLSSRRCDYLHNEKKNGDEIQDKETQKEKGSYLSRAKNKKLSNKKTCLKEIYNMNKRRKNTNVNQVFLMQDRDEGHGKLEK